MYLQVVNQGRNAKKKQKKHAKNIRHNANRTKREQAAQKLKEDNILDESTRRREAKKQDFIKFIIDQTLSKTDYINYGYQNSVHQMQSAWELAIQLGPYFYWVIMDYDNFTMPDPDILNINRYSWDKTYKYSISQLPSLDYILNIALRNGCNHLIIERILKSGANPNRSSFDYISANKKIIKKNQDQIQKNKEKDEEFERYKIFEAKVCRDICFAQSQSSNTECTGKCVKIARESYYGDWDDYDDDDVPAFRRDYSECYSECHLMPPLCIAAASGIIETIQILIKYKANITERVLEYNQLPCFKDNNPYHYILTDYNVLNYVNRSLNTECIEFIKSEFKKIQSDKQSIRQCAISAILNKRSIKHNNVNYMYIQGIYNNVKSFMGNTPNPLIKYIPINTRYSENYNVYKKANLHIHQSDIKKNVWILTRIPIFDIIKRMHNYNLHEFTNYIPNSYESGCYSFQPQYQPNRLPNIEYKNIGTIRIPKNKYKKLEVTIDNDLFGKTYQYNDDYEHYEKYIDFKHTRYSITAARGPIGLQDAAEQYPATCGKIAAPIRQDSITAARGPIGLQRLADQYPATCGKIAAPIRQDSITAARGPIGLQEAAEQYHATCGKIAAPIRQDSITAARGPIGLQEAAEQYPATCGKIAAPIRQDSITAARGPIGLQEAAEQYPATCGKIAAPIRQDSITAARGPIGLQEAAEQYHATCGKIAAPIRQDSITISCTFTGETESERINNMVQHYLLHKCVINTEIFGTYVFTRF
jgi:hypothetical protein